MSDKLKLYLQIPEFKQWTILNGGFLPDRPACHALMYYYMLAKKNQDAMPFAEMDVYEGEKDKQFNQFQLFKTISMIFDVSPEDMLRHWDDVDRQCDAMGFERLSSEWRWEDKPEIKTQ